MMSERSLEIGSTSKSNSPLLTGVILLFSFMTYWNSTLVSSGVLSFTLTPYVLLTSPAGSSHFIRTELVECWIAAIVWIVLGFVLGKSLFNAAVNRIWKISSAIGRSPSRKKHPMRADLVLLVVCVAAGAAAPILTPFDPSAQGDLRSTRLLKPLEKGIVSETRSVSPLVQSPPVMAGSVERCLNDANAVLLKRNLQFTHREGNESTHIRGTKAFLFGTDDLGRDVFSRLVYALRISLLIGMAAMACSVFIGSLAGIASGIAGGWIDQIFMRLTDLFLSIPSLFLVIALLAFFGNSIVLLILVLAGTGWMNVARLVRGEVLILRDREYILAARLLGRSTGQIVRDHVLPNIMPTIIVASVLQLGNVILAEAALSFLGLGIQSPTPSLGNMIGESLPYIGSAWWVGVFPGLVLSVFLVSVNLVAERLRRGARIAA